MKYLIPTSLDTERLSLRMFREGDWRDLHEYYGDPECARYTSRHPLRDYETWQKVAALVGHWELRNYGSYCCRRKTFRKSNWHCRARLPSRIGLSPKFSGALPGKY
jgi:RimJ/RimL family protein N-acetyltransferase